MWYTLPAGTPLYRVTRTEDTWADVLAGYGAFFLRNGGRYHTAGQPTVYASEDPLAALTEFGWHAGLTFCDDLGNHASTLPYPVSTRAKLWQFDLTTQVVLADLTSAATVQQIALTLNQPFPVQLPWNPHPDRYHASQAIATRLRANANPRPEGLLAPSVRTAVAGAHHPRQVVLFVLPVAQNLAQQTLAQRANLLDQWDIDLEFGTAGTHLSVGPTDPLVAWSAPWVRLSGANAVPKFIPRPGSKPLTTGTWFALDVRYTQH
jgi:RES domain